MGPNSFLASAADMIILRSLLDSSITFNRFSYSLYCRSFNNWLSARTAFVYFWYQLSRVFILNPSSIAFRYASAANSSSLLISTSRILFGSQSSDRN